MVDAQEHSQEPDEALITAVQDGDEQAFAELVYRHQGRVRACVKRYIPQDDTVDDIAQDVFITAYQSLERYQRGTSFPLWLIGIARNKALHLLRHERVKRRYAKEQIEATTTRWRVDEQLSRSAESEIACMELSALRDCLKKLKARSAELVRLHYFEGKTSIEIAETLEKTDSAIRMSLMRVRKALGSCMENQLPASDEDSS